MANGYIGKISAVVTANTSDLSRKLAGAKDDVDTFANRMVRSFNSASQAAEKSFAGLFTPLQRLQRQFTGRELFNLGEDAGKIRRLNREVEQLVLASRQLAAPLAAAAKQFDSLSFGTQRGFSGALSDAQAALLRVKDSVKLVGDAGASGFASISKQVQSTIVSINQLAEATKRVRALPTGNELAFSDPRLAGRLAAAQRAGEQAMSLAPDQIAANPQIAGLVRQINRVSELSVEASARLKNAIASGLDTQPAQKELVRLDGVLDGLIGRLNRNYQLIIDTSSSVKGVEELKRSVDFVLSSNKRPQGGLGLFGSQIGTEAERAIAEAKKVDAQFGALPDAARTGLSGLAVIASRIADEVARTGGGAQNLLAVLDRLRTGVAAAQPAAAPASTGLIVRPPDPPDNLFSAGDLVDRFRADQADRETAIRQRLGRQADDPVRQLSGVESRITSVKAALDSLPASVSSRFIPAIRAAEDELVRLSLTPGRAAEEVERLSAEVRRLEADSRRSSSAMNFRGAFGGLGVEGINAGLDENALRGYGAQLQVLQATLGRVSAEARGPGVAAFERLRNAIADAMDKGELETAETRAEIKRLTADAVTATAAVSGGSRRGLARRLQRTGDISRGFGGNAGLAIQQAAFAFEDFFSVQGGLDQRIRAAGNNISQLGFIIGGTFGLIGGIVVGVGAQFAAMLLKWADAGKTAEDRNAALTRSLEKQRNTVEKLVSAYSGVADALRQASGTSDVLRNFDSASQEANRERLAFADPGVRRQRDRLNSLERQRRDAERTSRISDIISIQNQEADARRRERARISRIEREPLLDARGVGEAAGLLSADVERLGIFERSDRGEFLRQSATALRGRRDALAEDRRRTTFFTDPFGSGRGALNAEINKINRELAKFEFAINRATSEITRSTIAIASDAAAAIAGAQKRLAGAVGEDATLVGARLASLGAALESALARLKAVQADEDLTPEQRQNAEQRVRGDIDALNRQRESIIAATNSVIAFQQALDRAGGNLARQVAQESSSAADQARRNANLERARVGLGLTSLADAEFARRQEGRAISASEAAAGRQRQIEADGRRLRNEFERGVLPADVRGAVTRRDQAQQAINSALLVEADPRSTRDQRRAAMLQRQAAEEQLAAAQAQIDAAFDQTDAARRQRRAADESDRREQADRLLREQLQRGRDLIESSGERAGREAAGRIRDLAAARDEARRNGDPRTAGRADRAIQREFLDVVGTSAERAAAETADTIERIRAATAAAVAVGVPNAQARGDAATRRAVEDSFRSTAPAIFALADAVQNSVLMGPSRAALTATDITTTDGARELTRLIRGDDPARDQNLVELRRQTQALQQVVQILRDAGVPIANN